MKTNVSKWGMMLLTFAMVVLMTGCNFYDNNDDNTGNTTPTEDYAPNIMRVGAYIEFARPTGSTVKIVFESNNVANTNESTASDGRINAGYYKYDSFNSATLTYNYQADGDVSKQYAAELEFTSERGGKITFTREAVTEDEDGNKIVHTFTYRK